MEQPTPKTKHPAVSIIIAALGPDDIAAALNLTRHSVREARTSGLFPAKWYGPLSDLCVARGVECPRDAFRWIEHDKDFVMGQQSVGDTAGESAA